MPVNAPKCKVCGSTHWLNEAHRFIDAMPSDDLGHHGPKARDRKVKPATVITGTQLQAKTTSEVGVTITHAEIVLESAKDRKAYMRAYMAKRRAK